MVSLAVLAVGTPAAFGQGGIYVTPIMNVPLTAIVTVQRKRILANGVTENEKSMHVIARDSQGRIFNVVRGWVSSTSNETPAILSMLIYDPQARLSTRLYPGRHLAVQRTALRPPRTEPPILYATPAASSANLSQETQTIAAADTGTGKAVQVVDEYWYSDELRLDMLIKHSDPITGSTTTRVTQLSRTDPDPAMFTIPPGYKVVHPGAPASAPSPN
jgi:hypothetical protein